MSITENLLVHKRHSELLGSRIALTLLLAVFSCQVLVLPTFADEASDWLKSIKSNELDPGVETKTSAVLPEHPTAIPNNPGSLRAHAAAKLKDGDFEAAITLVEKAIEFYPEDAESRQIYADALESKLNSRSVRDPKVYNQCVKQWYFVYKHATDPAMANAAGEHLRNLTRKSPFVYPTAKMYLSRVLMPEIYSSFEAESAPSLSNEEPAQVR